MYLALFNVVIGDTEEINKSFKLNIMLLRIPTKLRQTSWLFTIAAEDLNSGLPRNWSEGDSNLGLHCLCCMPLSHAYWASNI